jgi:ABC-type transporter Mla subunit MlaD
MTVFFGRRPALNFSGDSVSVPVRFERAPGIKRNTPVYKNGVQIGRVVRVELVEQDRMVEVTINLDRQKKIYNDEECRIRQTVITGDASLDFVKKLNFTGELKEHDPKTEPYLVGIATSDLMSGLGNIEGDLTKAIQNVAGAAEQLGGFVERLNVVIGTPEEFSTRQANFEAIVLETRQTMASMRQTTDGISRFVNDPEVQGNIRKVVSEMPDIIERSRVLVGESTLFVQETRSFIDKGNLSLDNLTAGLEKVTRTLDIITKIADQIEEDVPDTVAAVKRSALRLETLFSELTLIVQNFREADGTIKRLIRDPEAYEKILATLDNVEKITGEVDWMLRTDLKPIAHNAKILTDKAARDPSVFIRNLLRKEPPIKTMPYCFGSGIYATSTYHPPTTIIDGEVVEVIEEIPVQVSRTPRQSLPKMTTTQQSRTASPTYHKTSIPTPSGGRVVHMDPRYPGY